MLRADRQREFAVDVVRRLQAAGFRALWNGGCVRDLLMGRVPKDYDVATDARPDAVRNLFGQRRTLAVGPTRRCLDRLSNRLTKIAAEARKLPTP